MSEDRIPFDTKSIAVQLAGWALFFVMIVFTYYSIIKSSEHQTTDALIINTIYYQQ